MAACLFLVFGEPLRPEQPLSGGFEKLRFFKTIHSYVSYTFTKSLMKKNHAYGFTEQVILVTGYCRFP